MYSLAVLSFESHFHALWMISTFRSMDMATGTGILCTYYTQWYGLHSMGTGKLQKWYG